MVRNMPIDESNPFTFEQVKERIDQSLNDDYEGMYTVMSVPNITNIHYGRDVGYRIENIDLPDEIKSISATNIRKQMFA
jgi:hypothetical protein